MDVKRLWVSSPCLAGSRTGVEGAWAFLPAQGVGPGHSVRRQSRPTPLPQPFRIPPSLLCSLDTTVQLRQGSLRGTQPVLLGTWTEPKKSLEAQLILSVERVAGRLKGSSEHELWQQDWDSVSGPAAPNLVVSGQSCHIPELQTPFYKIGQVMCSLGCLGSQMESRGCPVPQPQSSIWRAPEK